VQLDIDRASAVPIYRQVVLRLKDMILAGTLPPGFRLPPERRLAVALGVNRTTVVAAYRELKADGLVDGHVGRGTQVLARRSAPPDRAAVVPLAWQQLLRGDAGGPRDPLLRDLLELTERTDVINLSVGLPAPELLPLDRLREVHDALLGRIGPTLLLHSPTEGVTAFREAVAELLPARGIGADAAEILITSGSQQGLDLAARLFLSPGDTVVVEEPSFFGALQVFRSAQARLLGVPTDAQGMRTDVLEAVLERHRPRLIYTLPTFQNPSGALLSLERRRRLLELAYRFQVPILEDDPYAELRYEGEGLPSLKALDEHGYVLYLSSFSKVLFPGLRIGFMVAPRPVLRQLVLVKQAVDLHSNTPGQWVLERFLREGHYVRHVATVRSAYGARRDAMVEALSAYAPAGVRWTVPAGGFYVWCALPPAAPERRLLALAAERGVSYLPGSACFPGEPAAPFARLNFTFSPPGTLRLGVSRLMEALERTVADRPARAVEESGTRPIV
jgi:DNA-binding transcriptional MocR family regulator